MLADLTHRAAAGELSRGEVVEAMDALLDATGEEEPKANFLRAWAQRGETASELAACAETLLPRAVDPGVRGSWNGQPLLDCCGTGGGGLDLLNVSTGIVFILAAIGIPVVKHGNRGLTKKSGSADVLEALGIRIDLAPERMVEGMNEVGAAFLFAPTYHRSFATLGRVRRQLGAEGQRTVFNLLGPLLNPARPDAQLVGVFKPEHVTLYADVLGKMNRKRFMVAWGMDEPSHRPIGEVSARGVTELMGFAPPAGGGPHIRTSRSEQNGSVEKIDTLFVRDAADSARRLIELLTGREKGLGRATLVINAAVGAWAQGSADSLESARGMAAEALDSGRALAVLRRWQKFSQQA